MLLGIHKSAGESSADKQTLEEGIGIDRTVSERRTALERPSPVEIELSPDVLAFTVRALDQWEGGPTTMTDELAQALGFADSQDFDAQVPVLIAALENRGPLHAYQWITVLAAAEISFSSVLFGVASEWTILTGQHEEQGYLALRQLQHEVSRRVALIPPNYASDD